MDTLISLLSFTHVTAGAIGLTVFWVPIFTRKGSHYHRLLGRVFKYCAYVVLACAGAAVLLRLGTLIAAGETPTTRSNAYATFTFLGYLSLVTFVILRHGLQVLKNKASLIEMNTSSNRLLARVAILASVLVVAYAMYFSPSNKIVLYALSPIGILPGIGILQAIAGKRIESKAWMYEHLGAMLGCGIAFHTAFAVFGSSRLFDLNLPGLWQALPWVLPTLVGVPATIIWTRIYKRRFGDI